MSDAARTELVYWADTGGNDCWGWKCWTCFREEQVGYREIADMDAQGYGKRPILRARAALRDAGGEQ